MSVTSSGCVPWRASFLCDDAGPLHSPLKVSPSPFRSAHTAHLVSWMTLMASQGPAFVPVLRRSCLFQENSATKRVSTMAYSKWYLIKLTGWKYHVILNMFMSEMCMLGLLWLKKHECGNKVIIKRKKKWTVLWRILGVLKWVLTTYTKLNYISYVI